MNAHNLYEAALPFGGFKESGFGRELGSAGLDLDTEVKSVWVDLSLSLMVVAERRAPDAREAACERRKGSGERGARLHCHLD